jgi:RNA polymerase sigma-70 factor (ECF subfamily)
MERVQQGDRAAYHDLFARYKAPIWSYLVRRTGDQEVSSELFQETFLRVWRSAATYHRGSPVKPWVYRVASNLARDRYRSSTREVETTELDEGYDGMQMADPIGTVDLERAIGELPQTLRSAFVLGAVHGMDHREVAEVLGISPDNARARISRARRQLRTILAPVAEA